MDLSSIIDVTITRQSSPTQSKNFNVALIVGQYASFFERVRYYSTGSLSELAKDVRKLVFDADLVTSNTIDMDVNGQSMGQVTYATSHAATMALIVTALELLSTVESAVIDPNDADSRTIIIQSATGVTNTTVTSIVVAGGASQAEGEYTDGTESPEYEVASAIAAQSPRIAQIGIGREDSGDATMTATLNAILNESQAFYGVITAERDTTKQQAAAAWCLSNKKIYATSSSDSNIIDQASGVDTTSLAYIFNNASNDRVSLFYKSDAATKYTEAAYLGQMLAYIAGTWTGNAKTLSGESVDDLTTTQETNAHAKKCNTYTEIGEVNVVRQGYVSNGEFTDIIVFVDWLEAKIQENVWNLMVNQQKIPYTDQGITLVENAITQILKVAQDNGAITPDSFNSQTKVREGGFSVTVPEVSNISQADKTNRVLNNVEFTCWYSNAIHTVQINGTLVL